MEKRICPLCGKSFIPYASRQKFCQNPCTHSDPNAKKLLQKEKHKQKTERFNEIIRQADELGISYGYYRALLNSGKTFEELKKNENPEMPFLRQ